MRTRVARRHLALLHWGQARDCRLPRQVDFPPLKGIVGFVGKLVNGKYVVVVQLVRYAETDLDDFASTLGIGGVAQRMGSRKSLFAVIGIFSRPIHLVDVVHGLELVVGSLDGDSIRIPINETVHETFKLALALVCQYVVRVYVDLGSGGYCPYDMCREESPVPARVRNEATLRRRFRHPVHRR